jgi:hypothetical protein
LGHTGITIFKPSNKLSVVSEQYYEDIPARVAVDATENDRDRQPHRSHQHRAYIDTGSSISQPAKRQGHEGDSRQVSATLSGQYCSIDVVRSAGICRPLTG